jgi:hypothetical protein
VLLLLKLLEAVVEGQLLVLPAFLLVKQVLKLVKIGILLLFFVLHTHCVVSLGRHQIGFFSIRGNSLRYFQVPRLIHQSHLLFLRLL